MKRNWYALVILAVLTAFLVGAGRYVEHTTGTLQRQVKQAYACAQLQDYDAAQAAYREAARNASAYSRWLVLLLRRNLVDQMNQTFATLAAYAVPDNMADLEVETARVSAQIEQLRQSFFGWP